MAEVRSEEKMAGKRAKQEVSLEVLEQLNVNAAGLDVGAEEIYVCVPADRSEESVRVFTTFTSGLRELANWLMECGIETVAMESTGVYWIPVYEILEERGLEVCLVNARHLKNVPGRKTDVNDCQWLQKLHTYGLLRASFRPSEEICSLRALARHRDNLIRYQSAHIQHMQKALQLMNIKLSQVVSDVTGVTGLGIIRAIVNGERSPEQLASLRDRRCAKSESEIAQALEGNYKREYVFVLKQALAEYDFYQQQIQECDAELQAMYDTLPPAEKGDDSTPPPPRQGKRRKNQPHFDLSTVLRHMVGVDLTAIDGVDALTVQTIITEIGVDVSAWPTVKHFTSWLGLAPCTEKTGGKVIRSRTKKTQNRATTAFRLAAQSLHHSRSALGAFHRRARARLGPAMAITATAHKLARIVYAMLKNRTSYVDPGEHYYEQQCRERAIRNLKRKAAILGMQVLPAAVEASLVS